MPTGSEQHVLVAPAGWHERLERTRRIFRRQPACLRELQQIALACADCTLTAAADRRSSRHDERQRQQQKLLHRIRPSTSE
jgi:hypothetical protein